MHLTPPVDSASIIGTHRPKLLVVDDQALNILVLRQTFSTDHEIYMATTGEQALAVCALQHPDLVLLDVDMPGMNGYEVCERLKASPDTHDIPVIFVTAHIDEASETRGLDAGAVDFISKPINPRIVRARVRAHLTLKEQSDLLRKWVYIDGLTGVCNRRHFDERLLSEWALAARKSSALSLILLDVDLFKRYNDRYGHQAGDDCLCRVAAAIKACLNRPTDQIARYGGEEFVCLLPDTNLSGALQVAEKLRAQVFALQIEHSASPATPFVTISLGVCSKPETVRSTAAELLRQADVQLYKAKESGRNQSSGADLDDIKQHTQ